MSTAPAEIAARLRHALEVTGKTQRGVERAISMSKGYPHGVDCLPITDRANSVLLMAS